MIVIRKAQAADMEALMALVDAVFQGEQGIPRRLNPIPPEKRPQWWCAAAEGEIVGSVALYQEDGSWRMGRLAVAAPWRRQGLGENLLLKALEEAYAQGIPEISMEARPVTVGILQTFGAEVTGEPFPFYKGVVTPLCLRREAFLQRRAR